MTMVSPPRNAVPRAKSKNTTQLVVRVPEDWLPRLDALIDVIASEGVATTRTDVVRAAIAAGLGVLEARAVAPKKSRK